ncbi:uncharacterized protein LOC106058881 [Biomphalaria glabrata]|uniref:Uncharacterized protein LOC106058881 n=1 Tax=Biomphalaria glabrata TaxID=6526 RepID=A0A9U8E3S6_BIOGL|nr:uncharacterized protein LOC106058881 [Biomphalaria glabrata]
MDRALLVCVLTLLLIGVIAASRAQRTIFRRSELPSLTNRNSGLVSFRDTHFYSNPVDNIGSGLNGESIVDHENGNEEIVSKRQFDEIGRRLNVEGIVDHEYGKDVVSKRHSEEIEGELIDKRIVGLGDGTIPSNGIAS